MRVLLITDTHNPKGGGTEKYFFTLQKKLQAAGLEVYTLGFGPEPAATVHSIVLQETKSKFWRHWWRLFLNPKKYHELKSIIEKIHPDLIHLHNVKKYTVALLKALEDYPVVQTVHDYSPLCPTGWNVHNDLRPCPTGLQSSCLWQHRRGRNVFAYLAMLGAFFRMNNLLKQKVRQFIAPSPLLEHYLRLNKFGATIYLPPFRDESPVSFSRMHANQFLYVGQLEMQKGVDILIEEFALAVKQNKNLHLQIAGDGSQKDFLHQRVAFHQLENNVTFLGWVDPKKYYLQCMALLFCSIGLESFGLVITEAMSNSRAVIGSSRGPTTWLVEDGESGLLFDPLKTGDLAAKIIYLAANPALAEEFGRHGRERMETFLNDQSIINDLLSVYASAQQTTT